MSIFIEFFVLRKDFEFGNEIKDKFVDKFEAVLEKGKIDYGEMKISIHKQLFSIFWRLKWLEHPTKGLKQYYLDLLSSKSEVVRARDH